MKIIKLGHYDVQITCSHCKTIYECSTDEMVKNERGEWGINCPVCNLPFIVEKEDKVFELLNHKEPKENKDEL